MAETQHQSNAAQKEAQELPMPEPTVPRKPLGSYKALSFDIYGTLIDWEHGILTHLSPLLSHLPSHHPLHNRLSLAAKYNEIEAGLQSKHPSLPYSEVLTLAYKNLARDELKLDTSILGEETLESEAKAMGESVGSWPVFPDTMAALHRLSQHYKTLIPLSNVDRESYTSTLTGPLESFPFTTSYLASDIGSYKPSLQNFEFLLSHLQSDFNVSKEETLHVAQSLFHDHIPAKAVGVASVWINRRGAGMGGYGTEDAHERGRVGYGWRFGTLGEFADEVERDAEGAKGE